MSADKPLREQSKEELVRLVERMTVVEWKARELIAKWTKERELSYATSAWVPEAMQMLWRCKEELRDIFERNKALLGKMGAP